MNWKLFVRQVVQAGARTPEAVLEAMTRAAETDEEREIIEEATTVAKAIVELLHAPPALTLLRFYWDNWMLSSYEQFDLIEADGASLLVQRDDFAMMSDKSWRVIGCAADRQGLAAPLLAAVPDLLASLPSEIANYAPSFIPGETLRKLIPPRLFDYLDDPDPGDLLDRLHRPTDRARVCRWFPDDESLVERLRQIKAKGEALSDEDRDLLLNVHFALVYVEPGDRS